MEKKLVVRKDKELGVDPSIVVNMLVETMQKLSTDSIDPTVANSIAAQSREICRVAKTKLEYARFNRSLIKVKK